MRTFRSSNLRLVRVTAFLLTSLSLTACVNSGLSNHDAQAPALTHKQNGLTENLGIEVATWNVEHLAYPFDTGCKPRTQTQIDAMRDYIEQVDADIYALQEVASKQAVNVLFPDDQWQVFISEREDSDPYTCRGSGNTSTQQKVAYAVRKGLEVNNLQSLSGFALNRPGLRHGLEINLDTALGEISLLNVHMKSGCFVDNYSRSDSEACKTFAEQAPVLDQWIESKEQSGTPYIVLGDFNHRLSAPYNHLTRKLLTNSDGSASSLQNTTADLIGCHPYYPAPIDQIFVGGITNNATSYKTQAHNFDNMQVEEMLSDHCAVTLSIGMVVKPLTNAVKWQTTSKEHQFLTRAIYSQASKALKQANLPKENWVVVMDVDETILDNSPYQVVLDETGASYTPASWANWVKQEKAELVPGVSEFVETVVEMGGKLALITNREKSLDAYTWRNLVAKGLAINTENTCLTGRTQSDKSAINGSSIVNDKDLRRQQIQAGEADCYLALTNDKAAMKWANTHIIAMEVGDNIEDFSRVTQEDANVPELIKQWPSQLILLPNPMYGSW